MAQFETPYSPLINTFDAIGWVPTIRGGLSLNVFDNSNSLLGDVDKFSIEVKTYDGFSSSRYLTASSLLTFDDNKKGNQYFKTFRFIFRGTVNDEIRQSNFIAEKFNNEPSAVGLFEEKELLIGKLSIVVTLSSKLSVKEKQLLRRLKSLSGKKEEYNIACKADSCEKLAAMRVELKAEWEKVEDKIIDIEKGTGENPVYKFDVVLSRDGILFLKDDTGSEYRRDFYKENTQSDYTRNIPIHRVFKTAMNFIKHLFHMNYHHSEEHDTFLPATNLHPIREDGNLNRIIKHQMEAFLSPVIRMKRVDDNPYYRYELCNPEGILLYAESFLLVCKYNKFITDEKVDLLSKFIDKQKKEYEAISSDKKSSRSFYLSQKNIFATLAIALSILTALIKTIDFLFKDSALLFNMDEQGDAEVFIPRLYIILGSFGLAALFHRNYINGQILAGKFNRKPKRKNILNRDSNINRGRFSILYNIRLFLINNTTQLNINKLDIAGIIIIIAIVSFLWRLSYHFLIN
jgi:hypothetical protein